MLKKLLLVFLLVVSAFPQSKFNVLTEGNKFFSDNDLNLNDLLRSGISVDSVVNHLYYKYHNQGFLNIKVEIISDSVSSLSDTLLFRIFEGKRFIIKNVVVNESEILSEEDKYKINNFSERAYLYTSNIDKISDYIFSFYEHKGYLFAEISLDNVEIIEENEIEKFVRLVFSVVPDKKTTIDKFRFRGNTSTKDYVIIRESGVKIGDFYSNQIAENIRNRLKRINIFSDVEKPQYLINNLNEGILFLEVKEGNTNTFDGIIGYSPGDANTDGYLTGKVNFSMRNLFGTMRAFSLSWQKLDHSSQDLEIKYFEPYAFSFPLNLYPSYFQRQFDSTYIERIITLESELILSESFSFLLTSSYQRVIPSATIFLNKPSNSSAVNLGIGIKYDTRDDFILPMNGIFFRTDYKFRNKTLFNSAENIKNKFQTLFLDFEFYRNISYGFVLFTSLHAKQITGDNLEYSDLFRLGGLNTLRGYSENQFIGSKIAFSNTELRFFLSGRNLVFAFFDAGYFFDDRNNELISKFKLGYGFGIFIETPLGVMKVNYGIGEDASFSKGKIHFGIINGF